MKLTNHDLQQIDASSLRKRTRDELLYLSQALPDDLKEARERLNQNSRNSSIPSGSEPPWFKASDDDTEDAMDAVYKAREGPPDEALDKKYSLPLANFKAECEHMREHSKHKKARAPAVEFLNDWEAIFRVLHHPHLPLTNNEAERALRHWVILRKISYGTRSLAVGR